MISPTANPCRSPLGLRNGSILSEQRRKEQPDNLERFKIVSRILFLPAKKIKNGRAGNTRDSSARR